MLVDQLEPTRRFPVPVQGTPRRRASVGRRRAMASTVLPFLAGIALVALYAVRAGAYDLVVFESYGLVVWWIVAIGVAVGLLPRSRPAPIVLAFAGALLAYCAWTALSLLWTQSAERTTVEIARSLDYLGIVALITMMLDRDTWRAGAAGVGVGALLVCVLAVGSRLVPGLYPANYVATALGTDRLSYPLGYWNAVAAWAAMSTAIGLAWSAHENPAWRRALALGLVPAACVTTYLSYSRAGVAGTALAAVMVIALSRNRITALIHTVAVAGGAAIAILAVRDAPQFAHASGSRGAGAVAGALLFASGLCAAVGFATSRLRTDRLAVPRVLGRRIAAGVAVLAIVPAVALGMRFGSHAWRSFTHPRTVHSADPAARLLNLSGSRYLVWKSALHAFEHNPATGTGAGTFQFWWNSHAADYEFLQDTHNIWLQNMAELGAPGLLLIVAVAGGGVAIAVAVRRRARRRASVGTSTALLSMFVVYLLHASVDWMWESTAVTVLALAGIAILGARLSRHRTQLRWPLRGGLVALAVLAGAVQVPGLLSASEVRRSQAAERRGRPALALAWANDAVSAEPWAASAYEQRGLVLESEGRLDAAAADLRRAIAREPTNYVHWLVLARIQTERSDLAAAARDYDQAHSLRPLASVFVYAPYFTMR